LTYLDAALIAIAFISGLLAMYRGLTRELLSILSWIIAALAVLYFVISHKPFAEEIAAQMQAQVPIVQVAIGALIFLIVLIVVHLITARISDTILDSQVGMFDRVLGFLFGVARGFVLVVIPYMFYVSFFPDEEEHYDFVRQAQTLPAIKSTGQAIQSTLLSVMPSELLQSPAPTEAEPVPEQQG
ncbi:MAG: CvpA family protein, partial [Pseudomonadota bacterium]